MGIASTFPNPSPPHFAIHSAAPPLRLKLGVKGRVALSPAGAQHVSIATSTNGRSV